MLDGVMLAPFLSLHCSRSCGRTGHRGRFCFGSSRNYRLGMLLVNVTTAPPVGAAADSVTVPCELAPPNTVVGDTATELTAVPCVTLPPILSVGSTDAYCRTNTLLNSATVPPSPYSATPPVARLLSVPCTSSTPSLYTSMWFPYAFTIIWYHVFALTVPTAASPSVAVEDGNHLYRYRLFVLFRSS